MNSVLLYNFALIALACYMSVNFGWYWILILIFYCSTTKDEREKEEENGDSE